MASNQAKNTNQEPDVENVQEKNCNDKKANNDRNWIKNDYRKLRTTLHEHREKVKQKEVEREDFRPFTYTSLNAYANTSVGDLAMKTNHNPVKCEPFGLRPGEVVSCECYRDTTLNPVLPSQSLRMDNRYRLCAYHQKEAETVERKGKEEKVKSDIKEKERTTSKKQTSELKHAKGADQRAAGKSGEGEQEKGKDGDDSESTQEPRYMRIPYQLPRERAVSFKSIKIEDKRTKQNKTKEQLNYDDLKQIRQNIKEQKESRASRRMEENYVMTQRDWKEMDFDSLYDLRLEADRHRLHFPLVRYFGAYKKGSRDAAKELAEPLNPESRDPDEMKKLESLVTGFYRAQAS